jgi:hypothetical protein
VGVGRRGVGRRGVGCCGRYGLLYGLLGVGRSGSCGWYCWYMKGLGV